jgi:hypothetical protein
MGKKLDADSCFLCELLQLTLVLLLEGKVRRSLMDKRQRNMFTDRSSTAVHGNAEKQSNANSPTGSAAWS